MGDFSISRFPLCPYDFRRSNTHIESDVVVGSRIANGSGGRRTASVTFKAASTLPVGGMRIPQTTSSVSLLCRRARSRSQGWPPSHRHAALKSRPSGAPEWPSGPVRSLDPSPGLSVHASPRKLPRGRVCGAPTLPRCCASRVSELSSPPLNPRFLRIMRTVCPD